MIFKTMKNGTDGDYYFSGFTYNCSIHTLIISNSCACLCHLHT